VGEPSLELLVCRHIANTADAGHEVMQILRRHPRASEKLDVKRRVLVEMLLDGQD
jgi:hypothetical protein